MTIKTYIRTLLSLLAIITLTACGGGSSGSPDNGQAVEQQGQFIDSVVNGLRFETASTSGLTDGQGQFSYRTGETIRFFVGDIFIGEAIGQAIITPVELVVGARDETNFQVQNIVMFLQTLDDDANQSNGITITSATTSAAQGQSINFALGSGVFEANGAIQILISNLTGVNGVARALIARTQAIKTFKSNLIALFAGDYQGSFNGDDTGSWTATINNSGIITGLRKSDNFGDATIAGTVASSGQSKIGGTVDSVIFSGIFNRNGNVSGSWLDNDGSSGTFSGRRIATPATGTTPTPINKFGSLVVSGDDSMIIGAIYNPNLPPVIVKDTIANTGAVTVNWSESITSNTEFESRSMSFRFNEKDGSLLSVFYIRLTSDISSKAQTSFYSYLLDCVDSPLACNSITLDNVQQQVTFTNTSLIVDSGNNNASGIIGLTGTLRW